MLKICNLDEKYSDIKIEPRFRKKQNIKFFIEILMNIFSKNI